jgi:predicted cobalt transporter CbtA
LTGKDPRKWYPEDGGWEMHVASTVSEWIVATSFCIYILSFVREFQIINIEEPQVWIIVVVVVVGVGVVVVVLDIPN